MKRYLILFFAAFVSIFIEALCVQWLPPYANPHLLVCLVVYLAFFELSILAAVFAFSIGLLADFSSGIVVGPWAGALVATYGLISLISQRLFVHSGLVMFAAAAIASIGCDLFYWLLVLEVQSATTHDLFRILGSALATGLVGPLIQICLQRAESGRRAASSRMGLSSVGA